ncbi:MAG TPA: ABC transporter permease, partial [Puia sp.]|nr:ABC transporter permease [Puia sp.]
MFGITTKLALRQLAKNKTFTLLNILGLTLGLTTFLLITLYLKDELSFDRYNKNADRIVRINSDLLNDGKTTSFADAAPPVAQTLRTHYPEVEATARICPEQGVRFRHGNDDITERYVATVDPDFFRIFTLPAIQGDPVRGLDRPQTLVLTSSAALRFFATTHCLNRTLIRTDDSNKLYTVVAVIEDVPAQSSFKADVFLTIRGNPILGQNHNFYSLFPMATFVELRTSADKAPFDKKLAGFMRSFVSEYGAREDQSNGTFAFRLNSTPLTAIHLHSHRSDELSNN